MKSKSLEERKIQSEIFNNYASPIATVLAAIIALWAVDHAVGRIVELRGNADTRADARGDPTIGIATVPTGTLNR